MNACPGWHIACEVDDGPDRRGRGHFPFPMSEDDGVTRLTLVFATFLCSLPRRNGLSLPPPKRRPGPGPEPSPDDGERRQGEPRRHCRRPRPEPKQAKQDFVITDQTEVKLDGHVCKFQDVPGTATVVSLDVAPDKKTILKIQFASKK